MTRTLILFITLTLLLGACAGGISEKKNLSEDMGSPAKVALLRERADDFWSSYVEADYERAYSIFDPFYRAKSPIEDYLSKTGRMKYHSFVLEDVKVEGNVGTVKVGVVFSLPKVTLNKQEFSAPESETSFEEKWLYIYDNWYKEYYLESLEMSFVEY
jgi:hypothetical protein